MPGTCLSSTSGPAPSSKGEALPVRSLGFSEPPTPPPAGLMSFPGLACLPDLLQAQPPPDTSATGRKTVTPNMHICDELGP